MFNSLILLCSTNVSNPVQASRYIYSTVHVIMIIYCIAYTATWHIQNWNILILQTGKTFLHKVFVCEKTPVKHASTCSANILPAHLSITHPLNPLKRHFRLIVAANRIFPPNFGPSCKTTFLIKNYPRAGNTKQWTQPKQFPSLDGTILISR